MVGWRRREKGNSNTRNYPISLTRYERRLARKYIFMHSVGTRIQIRVTVHHRDALARSQTRGKGDACVIAKEAHGSRQLVCIRPASLRILRKVRKMPGESKVDSSGPRQRVAFHLELRTRRHRSSV